MEPRRLKKALHSVLLGETPIRPLIFTDSKEDHQQDLLIDKNAPILHLTMQKKPSSGMIELLIENL